jgi:hypothetical protein
MDSANFWLPRCQKLLNALEDRAITGPANEFEQGVCLGMIISVEAVSGVCAPLSATKQQGTRVVVAYIQARPARMHESFLKLALEAMKAAWPCPK